MKLAIGRTLGTTKDSSADDSALSAVEILFERSNDPLRVDRALGDCDHEYVSVRSQLLSLGSPDPPAWSVLDELHAIAFENGACAVSDHLGFTRAGNQGIELACVAPLPRTESALEVVCRNIRLVQEYFAPLPFYVETIARPFDFRGTMSEAEFLTQVLERTDCGWLLDLTSVYANGLNLGFDPLAFIETILPIPEHVQLRLSGGMWDERAEAFVCTSQAAIPEVVWVLYRRALAIRAGRIDAVFLHDGEDWSGDSEWRSAVRRAQMIAEEMEAVA